MKTDASKDPSLSASHAEENVSASHKGSRSTARSAYEPPRILKRRAVAKVTLLSGGGTSMATGGVFGMM